MGVPMKKFKVIIATACCATALFGQTTANAIGHSAGHAGHATHTTAHTTGRTATHTGHTSHFNKSKGYGSKRSFPEYHSNGLNPIQRWWVFGRGSHGKHSQNKGVILVKDLNGNVHKVKVSKSVYHKWRNRGNELVYKQGHVYQIKNNHQIV